MGIKASQARGRKRQKPVGLVYIALAGGRRHAGRQRNFPGDRKRIRQFATQQRWR